MKFVCTLNGGGMLLLSATEYFAHALLSPNEHVAYVLPLIATEPQKYDSQ